MSDFKITDKNGIKLKTANKYVSDDLTITLTNEDFSNLVSENIKKDVSILGVTGTYEKPDGYIRPSGKIEITNTEEINVTNYKTAQVVDSNLLAENIKKDVSILGVTGTYDNSIAGVSYTSTNGIKLNIDETPSDMIVVNTSTEKASSVVINGNDINSTNIQLAGGNIMLGYRYGNIIATNLSAENIKEGVSILGKIGTYKGGGDTAQEDGLITRTLTSYINDRVTSIGSNAFKGCSNLTSIDLPNVTAINNYAFYSCEKLTSVNIPKVTIIGSCAFDSCKNLTSVDLPKATNISSYAFQVCTSLTSINIPNVTNIGDYAFQTCSSLTSVNIPKATSIGYYAFYKCTNLASVSTSNITYIGAAAFAYCSSITDASFPDVRSIEDSTFQYCSKLASVDISNATKIGSNAFSGCHSLTKLVITQSNNVCTLSNTNAFGNCYHFLGTTDSTYNPTGAKDGYIYVPDTMVNSYKTATNWSRYANQIKPLSNLYTWEAASQSFNASMTVGFNINGQLYFGTSNKPYINIDLGPGAKNISFSSSTPSAFPAELTEYSYNSTTGILTINRVYYKYPTTTYININYDKRKLDI